MSKITQKALAESLKKLMQTKPLSKITVNNVASDCELTRRTLYYYFHDIYELLEWIYKTELHLVLGENRTQTTWQNGFLSILEYLKENKNMVLNTYNSVDRNLLENHLYSEAFNIILSVVEELAKNINVSEKDKKYVANFYKIALVGVILEWIKNKMDEDPKDIIKNLDKIISGDIYNSLLKYENKGEV